MRILLVEDDHMLADTMLAMLREDQHTVDWLDDGQQALHALSDEHFDLAILDLTLPRLDGLDVLARSRSAGVLTPVIILTARSDLEEKLQGLDAGADDYLTKPFAMAELKARIRAVTRRGSASPSVGMTVGTLHLNPDSGQLTFGDQVITLPRSELQILHYLMRHPDQVATRRRRRAALRLGPGRGKQRPGGAYPPSAAAPGEIGDSNHSWRRLPAGQPGGPKLRNRPMSLTRTLIALVASTVMLIAAVAAAWSYIESNHELEELFDAELAQSTRVIQGLVHHLASTGSPEQLSGILQQTLQLPEGALDEGDYDEVLPDGTGHKYEKNWPSRSGPRRVPPAGHPRRQR